jgi:hypothetical protein
MYFVSIYENRRMKPVEIALRSRGGRKREKDGGGKSIKIYSKHTWQYHNVSPCTTNKIIKKEGPKNP